jgi:hypothetical protein
MKNIKTRKEKMSAFSSIRYEEVYCSGDKTPVTLNLVTRWRYYTPVGVLPGKAPPVLTEWIKGFAI